MWDLDPTGLRLLVAAGESWDEKKLARRAIKEEGQLVTDRFGQRRPHPAIQIQRDARLSFARLCRELGLSEEPDSRPPRIGGW